MRILYISFLMFTSLISAMQKPASLATLRAKQNAITKQVEELTRQVEELTRNLGMINATNIPLHAAPTRVVGFGINQPVIHSTIHNNAKPESSTPEARIPLTDCYLSDQRPINGRPTILGILKMVNAPKKIDLPEETSFNPIVPLGSTYSSYQVLDRNALEENQKADNFKCVAGFNLP